MKEISVVGGGSWATAIVKILTENKVHVNWYLRRVNQVESIKQKGINPRYLSFVKLNKSLISPSNDLQKIIKRSSIIFILIPSAQLENFVEHIDPQWMAKKYLVTSIKGTIGPKHELPSSFLSRKLEIPESSMAILGGPCHAEEIGNNMRTYMTVCSKNPSLLSWLAPVLARPYLSVDKSSDILGIEYAAIYKNVIGIMSGIAKGLNYGDNFLAVLISNAIGELQELLQAIGVNPAHFASSKYLGDLLVTGYSNHSRNRNFGILIGNGMSIETAMEKMQMVAEGYPATKGLYELSKEFKIHTPILFTAYRILYKYMAVATEFKLLERNLI